MTRKILSMLFAAGTLPLSVTTPAQADFYSVKQIDSYPYPSYGAISKNGVVAFVANGDSVPSIVSSTFGPSKAGANAFAPTGVNDNGDVVGVSFNNGAEAKTDYVFLTPRGGSAQLIATADDVAGAGIDNSGRIIVTHTNSAEFFNGVTRTGSISLAANQEFLGSGLMLSSGTLVTLINDTGTTKYATVSLANGVHLLTEEILPASTSLVRETSTGSVLGMTSSYKPIISDLAHAPVSAVGGVKDAVHLDSNGNTLFSNGYLYSGALGFPEVDGGIISESTKKKGVAVSCLFPKTARIESVNVVHAMANGTLIAQAYGAKGGALLLTPTGDAMKSYCAEVTAKIVGTCAKGFPKNSLSGSVKDGSRCQVEVSIKSPDGKALSNAQVASSSSGTTVLRGKTDKRGKLTFSFKVSGYTYLNLMAPYRNKLYPAQSISIDVSPK